MTVVNGRQMPDAAGKRLADYLEENGYQTARIAVECGGEILPKEKYAEKVIGEDETIEIVSFVGGG